MTKADGKKIKILLVCSGNTCRSPMAATILQEMLREILGDNFICISAGKSANHAGDIERKAINAMQKLGHAGIEDKATKQVSKELVDQADMVFCLGDNVFEFLSKLCPTDRGKIFKYAPGREKVPDPFDAQGFLQEEADRLWQMINPTMKLDWKSPYDRISSLKGRQETYDYVAQMMKDVFSPVLVKIIEQRYHGLVPKEAKPLSVNAKTQAKL